MSKLQQMFEVQSFSLDTNPQWFSYSFIAVSIIRCSKSAQKFAVQVCQVAILLLWKPRSCYKPISNLFYRINWELNKIPKIISKYCELVKLWHINLSGPVFFRHSVYTASALYQWGEKWINQRTFRSRVKSCLSPGWLPREPGNSQSTSSPSKPWRRRNVTAWRLNVRRDADVCTTGTNGWDPAAQPPTASSSRNRGRRRFRARLRAYRPAFSSTLYHYQTVGLSFYPP